MPKIEIQKDDLFSLIGETLTNDQLESVLESAKAELDDIQENSYKVELNDTNRPDLWSTSGIARQINMYRNGKTYNYDFFADKSDLKIIVDEDLEHIRPYIVGFAVKNIRVDEPLLLELIQNQEKFCQNFGHKRRDIAIGIYKLDTIDFPIQYKAVKPEEISFAPLGEERDLNLREILEIHPKGIEFGHIVKDYDKYPIILDKNSNVLSFPPIINSRMIGEVEIGDSELFVELTGFALTNMLLVANIMACDMADRGADIIPVENIHPFSTPHGNSFIVPFNFKNTISFNLSELYKMAGYKPEEIEIEKNLTKMGFNGISQNQETLQVSIPPYRNDIMHAVDVIEDFIIGKGLNNFDIEMPSEFTPGTLSNLELFADKIRNLAIGTGFQEVISNILTSKDKIFTKMNLSEGDAVEISNPMTESHNVLQNSLIPSLLEIETTSAKSDYPHRIFEVGEVALKNKNSNHGSDTYLYLGLLDAQPKSNFSDMRSYIDNLLYYAGVENFKLEEIDIPYLLKGRSGQIVFQDKIIGYLGEINPEILEKWDILMPCTTGELYLDTILSIISSKTRP